MSTDQALAVARPSPAATLIRDHMVQLAAWVLAVEAAIYGVPLLDPATLTAFGASHFQIPFLAVAAAAAFYGVGLLDSPDERRFWIVVGAGCAAWLATVSAITYGLMPDGSAWRDVAVHAGYGVFYVALLVATGQPPHVSRPSGSGETGRHVATAGMAAAVVGWFAYFALAPLAIDPALAGPRHSSAVFFVTLDAIVMIRFLLLAAGCPSPRWRVIFGSMALSLAVLFGVDLLDVCVARGVVALAPGTAADLLWTLPPLGLVLTCRLRHLSWPRTDLAPTHGDAERDRDALRTARLVLVLGAAFPVGHLLFHASGAQHASVAHPQEVVAVAAMVAVGALGLLAYAAAERDRLDVARARAAMDDRLREAKKMEALGRLSSTVTHEFLNLLNAIGGYVDLTLDAMGSEDANAANLRRAHDVVRRTTAFTKRLLILSRGQPFHPVSIPFATAMRDVLPGLLELAPPPVAVDARLDDGPGRVAIAGDSLRDMLAHLVTNAVEAMPHGGRLLIESSWIDLGPTDAMARAVPPGRFGRVIVSDTGEGMPKDVLAHAFEPFFTTKAKPRARGLGLATVYVLATQHGGCASITSAPGAGTTVEFLLPEAS